MTITSETGRVHTRRLLWSVVLLNAALITALFGRFFHNPDTPCYVAGARLLFGLPGGKACDFRILKPFPLIIPGLLEYTTGIDPQYGLFVQNLLFYFLCSWMLFEVIRMILKEETPALWGVILFITAPPTLLYGLAYFADMPGWFFGLWALHVTLKQFRALAVRQGYAFLIGCIAGIGFLWKESALVGAFFFGAYVLVSELPKSTKLRLWLYSATGFFLPILICTAVIYTSFQFTFWTWYKFIAAKPYGNEYDLSHFIGEIARTFYTGWFLCLVGVLGVVYGYCKDEANRDQLRFFVASGTTLLLWPLWPYPAGRIFFLSAPFLTTVASYGAMTLPRKRGTVLVVLAALFNYAIVAIWTVSRVRGIAYVFGIIYLPILLWCFFSKAGTNQTEGR